jgi:hypothetical protein
LIVRLEVNLHLIKIGRQFFGQSGKYAYVLHQTIFAQVKNLEYKFEQKPLTIEFFIFQHDVGLKKKTTNHQKTKKFFCAFLGRPVPVMRHLSAYQAQALSMPVSAYKKWFGGRL